MIAIGSDHGGFKLKEQLLDYYKDELKDFGAYNEIRGLDEPKVAIALSEAVANGEVEKGILICRSGIGMTIAANKVKGIRAALVTSVENAHLTKEHNNANILCLGAKDTPQDLALNIVDEFVNTPFAGGRHERRVNKLMETEE